MKRILVLVSLLATLIPGVTAAQQPEYLGYRACTKCHYDQGETWATSAHAKAFDSLKTGIKAEAKTKESMDQPESLC